MKEITIGVLAGMGPRATAPFVDMLVTECQRQYGAKYDEDFPRMMIYSLPVPFRADEPSDEAALCETVCAGLRRLASTGVAFVAMPCNTAHLFYDELTKCIGVPLLNMIDETVRAVPPSSKRAALLTTRMTADSMIYVRGLERAHLSAVWPADWQPRVDALITTIKTSPGRAAAQAMWDDLVSDAVAVAGADTVLLGCTDLNAIDPRVPAGVTLLDATACLARAAVRRYAEEAGLTRAAG